MNGLWTIYPLTDELMVIPASLPGHHDVTGMFRPGQDFETCLDYLIPYAIMLHV